MTFFYKFWKKARVYYTLSISRGVGPAAAYVRTCVYNVKRSATNDSIKCIMGVNVTLCLN